MINVTLFQTQFSNSYENVVDFANFDAQYNWFYANCNPHNLQVESKCDAFRTSITVAMNIDDVRKYDYLLMYEGGQKAYYYFINGYNQNTLDTTDLLLQIDVFQTYMFDYQWLDTFVDRCHVPRWESDNVTPTDNNLDEGLEYGSIVIDEVETVRQYAPSFIIVATTPIGNLDTGTGGGGTGTGGGNPATGEISCDMTRTLKGYEGFARLPYDLGDGTLTIGYGTTQAYDPDHYNQLAPECTEKDATLVMMDSIKVNYGVQVKDKMVADGVYINEVKQQHFDAFTDLCYNAGFGGFSSSPMYAKFLINPADPTIYTDWLDYIVMPGTEFEEGLRARRKAEADIYRDAIYEKRDITNITDGGIVTDNDGNGYLPCSDGSISQNNVVTSARKLLGTPYVYGGNYPPLGSDSGTDCSGLMQWAYNDNGITISRTTYTQINEGTAVASINDCQPGDLLFPHAGHVVMYTGKVDGTHRIIHAPRTGTVVQEVDLYFTDPIAIRRIL